MPVVFSGQCSNRSKAGRVIATLSSRSPWRGAGLAEVMTVPQIRRLLKASQFDHFPTPDEVANGTEYGLTGGLYSSDERRLERAAREFHVGNLYLNRKITGALVGIQPFGGFNMSGSNAKAGGPDYLRLFMEMKTVARRYDA